MRNIDIVILASDHPNDAVLSVGEWMAGGLRAIGIKVSVLSIPRNVNELSRVLNDPIYGIISLGPMPLNIKVDQTHYLWQKINCYYWIYMLDAIIYDLYRVPIMRTYLNDAQNNDKLSIISPENGYFELLGKKSTGGCLPEKIKKVPFGHFANLTPITLPKENRLCIIGTIGTELGLNQDINTIDEVITIYSKNTLGKKDQYDLIKLFNENTIPEMPVRLLSKFMRWKAHEILYYENLPLICAIDSFYKRERRLKAVKSLSGLPIDIYGNGWERFFANEENFRFLGNIKHQEIALHISKYTAVINFDPNWENGVHDRVYTSTAMGVPIITNQNSDLINIDAPSNLIYPYSNEMQDLPEIANRLLSSKKEGNKPNLRILTEHSWVNRMAQIIN